MRIYKISSPTTPAVFRTSERDARALARELGVNGRVESLDVGTTKTELLPFLDALAHAEFQRGAGDGATERAAERDADPAPAAPAAAEPVNMVSVAAGLARQAQPATGWGAGLHSAERADKLQGNAGDVGRQVDGICDTIAELGGYHLGNVAHAVAARFGEIERQARELAA